jgi:hypothetical protein
MRTEANAKAGRAGARVSCLRVVGVVGFCLCISCGIPRALLHAGPGIRFIKVDLPLTFTGYAGRYPVVTARIQGRSFRLLLDTGSHDEAVGLSEKAAAGLDVHPTGKMRLYRDAYGGCYRSREFIIPSIELGDLELTGVIGNERPASVYGLDGAIGLELLSKFDVLIDYERRMLTLFRPNRDHSLPVDAQWHRYEFDGDLCLSVEFEFLDGRHPLLLDTGCGCNFVARESPLGEAMRSNLDGDDWAVPVGGGTSRRCLSYTVDRHYLGDYDIGNGQFVLGDLPPHLGNGVLGYDFFAGNLVYVRFSKREIWLKRAARISSVVAYGGVRSTSHSSGPPVSAFGHSAGVDAPGGTQSAPSGFAVPH